VLHALARYARHYAGVAEDGVRLIRGVFADAAGTVPGVIVESEVELPVPSEDAARDRSRAQSRDETASVHCSDTN